MTRSRSVGGIATLASSLLLLAVAYPVTAGGQDNKQDYDYRHNEHSHKKQDYRHKHDDHHHPYWKKACEAAQRSKLQILHSSDNESSFQDPNTLEEKILNYASVVNGLQQLADEECTPSLHLTAGDHTLPGPFYLASSEVPELGQPGLGDIAMYNAMDLAANGIGNHEFDGGIDQFAHMLNAAQYPFIAVNLDFSQVELQAGSPAIESGKDARSCEKNPGKVVKSCWISVGDVQHSKRHKHGEHGEHGEKVGLIGRAPADFFNVISNPTVTLPGLDFVGGRNPDTNQPLVSALDQVLAQVDLLEAQGIKRIILLDHAQDFTGDPLSANLLRGIDIVVAAGSTGFMAKDIPNGPFNLLRAEDSPSASYPTERVDSEGNTVLVVNSDQQYRYVGNLIVTFNQDGHIIKVDDRSGPVATTEQAIAALETVLQHEVQPANKVTDVFAALKQTASIQDAFNVIGSTTAPLNGNRADVRSRETNLGRVTADSTLWFTRLAYPATPIDVALKNGGGIRDTIQGPSIIRLTIQAALAFDNNLAVLQLTAAQMIAAMENAVSRVPALDGRFPQIAGMTLEYDASLPGVQGLAELTTPSRIRTLHITRADGSLDVLIDNFIAQGDMSRTFVMATNDFLSTGGDGYAALAAATKLATTTIGEQSILEQYIIEALGGAVDVAEPLSAPRVVRLDTP